MYPKIGSEKASRVTPYLPDNRIPEFAKPSWFIEIWEWADIGRSEE